MTKKLYCSYKRTTETASLRSLDGPQGLLRENLCARTAKLRSGCLTGRRECDKLPENFGSFVEGFAQNGRKRQKTLTRGGSLCYHSGQ